jgi:tetratricopeptide (TPR) repeat protein
MKEGALTSSRVVPLIHKPQAFEDAVSAFAAARNTECVSILRLHTSASAAFLRARALIRLRRLRDAQNVIEEVRFQLTSHSDLAQYYALLGTVLERQLDVEHAVQAFVEARAYAYGIPSVALNAELAYYEALGAWRRHDFEQVEAIAAETLQETRTAWDEPHSYPIEVSHALLHELLALVCSARKQHEVQIDHFKQALQTLSTMRQRHVWAEAGILWNFTELVPELRIADVAILMREHAETLPWTSETAAWAYDVYRSLGWNEALCGNYVGAFRDMRVAHNHAPTMAWRVESILDRAYLFCQIGESVSACERLEEADQFCKQIDWACSDQERYVLLWAAEIAADIDAERASRLLAQYKFIRKPIDPILAASVNARRWQAHEDDAYAAVEAAKGQTDAALAHLRSALATWDDLKFEWRAAKTANAIASITKAIEDIAGARRRAEPFAKSWLARKV